MKKLIVLLLSMSVAAGLSAAPQNYTLKSPDSRLEMRISVTGGIRYDVLHDGVLLLEQSQASMTLGDGTVYGGPEIQVRKVRKHSEDHIAKAVSYKKAEVRENFNELEIECRGGYKVIFRAYDDACAYRFISLSGSSFTVVDEQADFRFAGDWDAEIPYINKKWKGSLQDILINDFQCPYTRSKISSWKERWSILPLLVDCPGGKKVVITEADLMNYPGMFLYNYRKGGETTLSGYFARIPDKTEIGGHNMVQEMVYTRKDHIAEFDGAAEFPWRVVVVSSEDRELADSDIVWKLATPAEDVDWSWVRPGKVAWEWWNAWNLKGVDFETGVNDATYMHYIDFAAENGIEYVILDEGWAVKYANDLMQVVPEIHLDQLVKYAAGKGVGIILWAGWWPFEKDMENVCRHFSEMGVKGFKVDFMNRDDQPMVDWYRRAAEMCAKYHLLMDFHGSYKPTGLQRTYPNVVNFEGVHGLEQMKWSDPSVDQVTYDVTIPFIRQVAGPMDYTQGAMRNATRKNYFPVRSEPMSQGTRCRQLAEYVVFESPLNMMCDSPVNYRENQECTDFISTVPTVWDETVALDGKVREYVAVARRSGDEWYVGAMTDWSERELVLDLGFLPDGDYVMEVFCDGVNAKKIASDYKRVVEAVPSDRKVAVKMAPGGGWAAKITAADARFILQAHRGISNRFPENTNVAFRAAAESGKYAGMETDVQMTSDGVIVCMHDKTIDRTTDGTGSVSDYTYDELQKLWIDGGYGWNENWAQELKIPTFADYLEACRDGGLIPYVELKRINAKGIRKVVNILDAFGFAGNYVLTSFSWKNIKIASEMTDAPLEFMKKTFTKEEIDSCGLAVPNLVIRPSATLLTKETVDYCHSKNIPVECFGIPVGDGNLVRKLASWGVRGGTCNDWRGLDVPEKFTKDNGSEPIDRQTYPQWLDTAAIYHIYPSSFKDSDGDGYGDLEGIRSKLGYIRDLGFNTIWISPIFCSMFEDGGYDITDYYSVDPRFGTNAELVRLLEQAHSIGMRVCLDLVAGHTSDKHPWFVKSATEGPDGQYADYYIWTTGDDVEVRDSEKSKWVKNDWPRGGMYLKNYYDVQPALNYGYLNPSPERPWEQSYDAPGPKAVRREIKNIIEFWFNKGVDGFRCDLASSLVKGDDAEFNGVRKLWNEIFTWSTENWPDRIFLSEWSSPVESISCGFDIDIIRHNGCGKTMYRSLVHNTVRNADSTGVYRQKKCWFDKAGDGKISDFVIPYEEMYSKTLDHGFPCMPTSSHDTWRMNRGRRSDPQELKTMMTFFLTMPWVPIVYYGEEIGMRSMDGVPFVEGSRDRSAQRTPMQWEDGPTAGFSTCDPSRLYLPIDDSDNRPTVAAEIDDPSSLYNWTKGLLSLRRSIPALGNRGGWRFVSDPQVAYPAVYERFEKGVSSEVGERYIVIINPRAQKSSAVLDGYGAVEVIYGSPSSLSQKKTAEGLKITIDGVSSVVCKVL